MWTYRAQIVRVVDGDTVEARVDLGLRVIKDETVRLARVNTPELNTAEGQDAKRWVQAWVAGSGRGEWSWQITTSRPDPRDRYGRFLAEIVALSPPPGSAANLSDALLTAGVAAPWP